MKTNRSSRGFTLIEMVIILGVMLALAAFSMPELFAIMNRARLEGTARQTATLFRAARLESIKQSCYGVVMLEPANERVVAFVDCDRDGLYDPTNTPPEKFIGQVDLPARVHFENEAGNRDLSSVDHLINEPDVPVNLPDYQVMYEQNGAVLAHGALRFADEKGNVLEVRVDEKDKRTGKVEVRKYQDGGWITNGEGGKAWKFNK